MWLLNILILTAASIAVGFILGWIVCRPKRWDYTYNTGPTSPASLDDHRVSLTTRG